MSLLALPRHLLEAIVALVPDEGGDAQADLLGLEEEESGFSCEGCGFRMWTSGRRAVEAACRLLRRAALALPPACITLRFNDGGWAARDLDSLLHGLRRRPPALRLLINDLPDGIPPAAWEQLAAPLLSGARQLLMQGSDLDLLLKAASRFMRLHSLTVYSSDYYLAPLPNPATLGALTSLTSIDLVCEALPAELAAVLASLPQLQSVILKSWQPPEDDSGAWPQLAALGSRLRGLHMHLRNALGLNMPARLPPGLLALTAAGGICLDVHPGLEEQEGSLPGLDSLPGVERVQVWATLNTPEIWRCRNLNSLEFYSATVSLPPDAQPAAHLTRLTSLNLGRSSFAGGRLPPALCSLPSLQLLTVDFSAVGELSLPPQASDLTALQRLSLGRLSLNANSCVALASIPALTRLRFREVTSPALPAGPYQASLSELYLLGSKVTGQELPPPSISGASQLTALRFSLHTLSPVALREQWPALLATLQGLPALKDIGVHCSREQNREAQEVVALLRELLGGSVLRCIFQGWIGSDEPIFW